MTTLDADQPEPSTRTPRVRHRGDLGDHVARTVSGLQERLLRDAAHPEAVSALARLRRGIGRGPGLDYTLERYLQVPCHLLGRLPADDCEAADSEYAVHDAMTLYALHQQSRRERMHVDGRGLGWALASLVRQSSGPDGVRRRFAALGTASTYGESIYHLRSLITMLREHQIPLDYGLLADDLRTLRRPDGHTRMQSTWGREYFRSGPSTNDSATDHSATDTPQETAS